MTIKEQIAQYLLWIHPPFTSSSITQAHPHLLGNVFSAYINQQIRFSENTRRQNKKRPIQMKWWQNSDGEQLGKSISQTSYKTSFWETSYQTLLKASINHFEFGRFWQFFGCAVETNSLRFVRIFIMKSALWLFYAARRPTTAKGWILPRAHGAVKFVKALRENGNHGKKMKTILRILSLPPTTTSPSMKE